MKKIFLLYLLALVFQPVLKAQKIFDQKTIQATLKKDTGYNRFQKELDQLRKTAKGKNTNASAVKSLFARNKTMLTNVSNSNKVSTGPSAVMAGVKLQVYNIKDKLKLVENPGFGFIAPYSDHWLGREWDQRPSFHDGGTDTSIGKMAYTYYYDDNFWGSLGGASVGFKQTIRVPANPDIVAARVEFEYSFHLTGWDTKEASFRVGLLVQCVNFVSAQFLALPELYMPGMYPEDKWRRVKELTPVINITEDVKDFEYNDETPFVIEGNVVPGTDMTLSIGPGYRPGDHEGIYTCYHYGEFRLKKIKVSYMKAN